MSKDCFECGCTATEDHHVIPQSLGGTKTVHLCGNCHNIVHSLGQVRRDDHRELTKEGLRKAKERGVVLGNTVNITEAQTKGRDALINNADLFCIDIMKIISHLLESTQMNYVQIAGYLNKNNIPTARGGRWYCSTVSNLIQRYKKIDSKVCVT